MNSRQQQLVTYSAIALLMVISFFICYAAFTVSREEPGKVMTIKDQLSEETYSTDGAYNYRDGNIYGSYLIGFGNLTDAGITSDDMIYIHDVLINFAMYDQHVYNGKISYVKDSLETIGEPGGRYRTYEFRFGLNNSDIHTMRVKSSWVDQKIDIAISNSAGKQVFQRAFDMLPEDNLI